MTSFIGCKVSSRISATDALGTWTATYNHQGLLATIRNTASRFHLTAEPRLILSGCNRPSS